MKSALIRWFYPYKLGEEINQSALWANSWIDRWLFGLCLMLSGLGNFVVDCHI